MDNKKFVCSICKKNKKRGRFFNTAFLTADKHFVCCDCHTEIKKRIEKCGIENAEVYGDLFDNEGNYSADDYLTHSSLKLKTYMDLYSEPKKTSPTVWIVKVVDIIRINGELDFNYEEQTMTFLNNTGSKPQVFKFNQLMGYEYLENSETISQGGGRIGRAVLGGLVFGATGAVVGALSKEKTVAHNEITDMRVLLTLKAENNRYITKPIIFFSNASMPANSEKYADYYKLIKSFLARLEDICSGSYATDEDNASDTIDENERTEPALPAKITFKGDERYAQPEIADDSLSEYELALKLEKGKGVKKDLVQAMFWCRQAAEKGLPDAQAKLGDFLMRGKGCAVDTREAYKWYERAAQQGHQKAMIKLGERYYELANKSSWNADPYYEQAFYWYRNAYAVDESNSAVNAILGVFYVYGKGTEKNIDLGMYLLQEAAKCEESLALFNLGLVYLKGEITQQDPLKAVDYFQRAANRKYTDAMFYLGTCYRNGIGVETDIKHAKELFQAAAIKGHRGAQYGLAQCLREGAGCDKNIEQAAYWESKANEG